MGSHFHRGAQAIQLVVRLGIPKIGQLPPMVPSHRLELYPRLGHYLRPLAIHHLCYFDFSSSEMKLKAKRNIMVVLCVVIVLILIKVVWVAWGTHGYGSTEGERKDILQRSEYLASKLVVEPRQLLKEMPSAIGSQFQGEWALYSCSMYCKALANISRLYPDTKVRNLALMDSLIEIVKSPEIRLYDWRRWGEDPLESLHGEKSHVSYLSHLAWMIGEYKSLGGTKHNELQDTLLATMNRRILQSPDLNLRTYPGEPIYVPDMLVAIVALHNAGGKYQTTVEKWLSIAKTDWLDDETGLLISVLRDDGSKIAGAPVKGSYSALNCYYLTLIDTEFARKQYDILEKHFKQGGLLAGLKEYHDQSCWFGLDIDAGPIIGNLSPSGTAFAIGSATYFGDEDYRNKLLRTAEMVGHTISWNGKSHYLLANIALVGESITLAMRTNYNFSKLGK